MGDEAKSGHRSEGPGGSLMGWRGVTITTTYLVLVTIVVIHGLVVLWPPDGDVREPARPAVQGEPGASPEPAPAPAPTTDGGAREEPACRGEPGADGARFLVWNFCLYTEERLFLIVLFAGALGGLVHALRSFSWYLGNRELVTSWMGKYFTQPVVGAAMAVIFYLVIRGGFTPSDSNFDQTNPFGFAAMAVLVGMFSEQAAERLKEIAETIFARMKSGKDHAPAGPAAGKGSAEALTVTGVVPGQGGAGAPVTISGTGFQEGAEVFFGGKPAPDVKVVDATQITAAAPEADQAGPVAVEVAAGDRRASVAGGFTYEET